MTAVPVPRFNRVEDTNEVEVAGSGCCEPRRRALRGAGAVPALRRPVRVVLLWALGLGAGCADVLDVPSHPHLAETLALPDAAVAPAPAEGATPEGSAAAKSSAPASETTSPASAREGGADSLPLTAPASAQTSPAPRDASEAGVGGLDAGTPPPASNAAAPDAATSPAPAPAPDPCGTGRSLGPNGDCFTALATSLSWADARQSCRELGNGWDLASILSVEENTFVAALAGAEAWIGASDAQTEGTWLWVRDGRAFWRGTASGAALNGAYTSWNPGEPNGSNNSNCGRIVPELSNTWADLECGMLRPAVCEGPPPNQ